MNINISDSLYLSDSVERKIYPDYIDAALINKAIHIFLFIATVMIIISITFQSPIYAFVIELMLYYIFNNIE